MDKTKPLAGIKVASFCWIAVGPATTRYLALWGATVVRLESHRAPCLIRLMTPYKDGKVGLDRNAWFPNLNSSSYSLSVDLNLPKGMEIAWKLIQWADVVAENFGPGRMKKWGIDYESVKRKKPDVVYLSSSQLGQTGPYASYVGYGYQASAMGGFTYLTGWPDRVPIPYHGAYTDFTACRFGAAAILAALEYRRRTGRGVYIDQSQMECCTHVLAPLIMDYVVNGRIAERSGNEVPWAVPHGVYRCQGDDKWCAICVTNEEEWRSFCGQVNEPWTKDPRFGTFLDRKKNEAELDRLVAGWTVKHQAKELEERLQKARVPASVVNSVRDLVEDDPQVKHRGYFRKFQHSVIGEHIYRGPAFKLEKNTDGQFAGPAIGEHNEYVLKEVLGISDDEIADALVQGAITTENDLPPDIAATF